MIIRQRCIGLLLLFTLIHAQSGLSYTIEQLKDVGGVLSEDAQSICFSDGFIRLGLYGELVIEFSNGQKRIATFLENYEGVWIEVGGGSPNQFNNEPQSNYYLRVTHPVLPSTSNASGSQSDVSSSPSGSGAACPAVTHYPPTIASTTIASTSIASTSISSSASSCPSSVDPLLERIQSLESMNAQLVQDNQQLQNNLAAHAATLFQLERIQYLETENAQLRLNYQSAEDSRVNSIQMVSENFQRKE